MLWYEHVIREHELRVARSLEKYVRRTAGDERSVQEGYVLLARARRSVGRSR